MSFHYPKLKNWRPHKMTEINFEHYQNPERAEDIWKEYSEKLGDNGYFVKGKEIVETADNSRVLHARLIALLRIHKRNSRKGLEGEIHMPFFRGVSTIDLTQLDMEVGK